MRIALVLTAVLVSAGVSPAQSNVIVGLDSAINELDDDVTYWGRRGPAYPDGEVGITFGYYMCNVGTVAIEWYKPQASTSRVMDHRHPVLAYMVARVTDDRLLQITDRRTYAKHGHGAGNSSGRCSGTCIDPGTAELLAPNCYDAYSANTNSNRFWLAPDDEVNPWTGSWDPYGTYFDRGDPAVTGAAASDGVRSLLSANFADPVKNRITLRESDLLAPGRFYYQMQTNIEGEDADLRGDNIAHREMTPSWDGQAWSFAEGAQTNLGSVLNAWPGAAISSARNGEDDGTFYVAVKVTEPVPGTWHYEYAVHNFDNHRGGATLRIPLCPSTPATNVGFRDPDSDPLNDWTWSQQGDELVFEATSAALRWNMIFNFWFDAPVPPVAGAVTIDQAQPGSGALFVDVPTQVPGGVAAVTDLGPGCGAPSPVLSASALPLIPSPGFEIDVTTSPNAPMIAVVALAPDSVPLGGGCTRYLMESVTFTHGFLMSDASGAATIPLPIPNSIVFDGTPVYWQVVQEVSGGALLGAFTVSNGLELRAGCR